VGKTSHMSRETTGNVKFPLSVFPPENQTRQLPRLPVASSASMVVTALMNSVICICNVTS
jgi:hypothetical protein